MRLIGTKFLISTTLCCCMYLLSSAQLLPTLLDIIGLVIPGVLASTLALLQTLLNNQGGIPGIDTSQASLVVQQLLDNGQCANIGDGLLPLNCSSANQTLPPLILGKGKRFNVELDTGRD